MGRLFPVKLANKIYGRLSSTHRKGLFGLGWTSAAQLVGMVIKLGSTLILTRLLAPEAYGILGTAMVVLTTLEWLSDVGIMPALIRHENGDQPRYLRTAMLIGFSRACLLASIAAASAYPLADFYQQPELVGVLLVLALRPIIIALRSPAYPLLRRNLEYKSLFIDEVAMTAVGTICSIAMAVMFHSVWAIVLGTIAGAVISTVLSYFLAPMMPKFQWDKEAARDLCGFGRSIFLNTLIMAAWLNLDRLLGLRLLSPTEMGLYSIAFNLILVIESLVTRGCDVYFSMLAREDGPEAQGAWHERVSGSAVAWVMPLGAIGLLVSPWVIWILYDSRYAGAGLVFSILLARLMIRAFGQMQFQYLLALAQVRLATYGYIAAVAVQFAMFWPMVNNFGVIGMALTTLTSTLVLTFVQSAFLQRNVGSGMRSFTTTCGWAVAGLLVVVQLYGNPLQQQSSEEIADKQVVVEPEVADERSADDLKLTNAKYSPDAKTSPSRLVNQE